jgi:hypothetical protein
MKEIQLTQGKVALVDDEDFEYLNQWKWYANKIGNTFYALRSIHFYKDGKRTGKAILMHREILNPENGLDIDHINRNGLDNRRCNIRIVTRRQNLQNRKNQAELIGSYIDHAHHNYRSSIFINGKAKFLGVYRNQQDAHKAYMKAVNNL